MDRVFPPTRTARTMRERVEARRTRQQRIESSHSNFGGARPFNPPDAENTRPETARTLRSASAIRSTNNTKNHGANEIDEPMAGFSNDSTFADRRAEFLPGGRPSPVRSAPVRLATGSMAVPRHRRRRMSGLWGGTSKHGPGRVFGAVVGGAAFTGSIVSSLAAGWRDLDPDLQHIAKMVLEFIVAVIVVAGLVFGLFSSGERPVKATNDVAATPSPQPVAAAKPSEPVRIMLLGSDRRSGDTGYRTDVMLLVTIDASEGQVSVLSFPRDLVGKIPGYGDGRINIVMGRGGFSLMQDTFEESYGVRPQYYFLINFEGFVGLINSIGGIEIEAEEFLEDSCDNLPLEHSGVCKIEPGKHSMDGATALWYVRSRHSSSDFDRLRRAQEVMGGIFHRLMSMKAISRLPELYLQYSQDVETNMTIPQIGGLLPTAADIAGDTKKIKRYTIPEEITADWIMPDGARVLLPDYEAVKKLVRKAALIKK